MEQLLQERLDAAVAQDPSPGPVAERLVRATTRPARSSESSGSRLGIGDILGLPGGSSGLPSRREIENSAVITAQAEPPDGSGQGIRDQISAGEPYAGNPVTN